MDKIKANIGDTIRLFVKNPNPNWFWGKIRKCKDGYEYIGKYILDEIGKPFVSGADKEGFVISDDKIWDSIEVISRKPNG